MKRIMHNMLKTAVVSALMLTATAGYAQKKRYPYVQDGNIIVCREGNDGVKASLIHPNWTTTLTHNELDATNNRFAAKFEVATSDAVGKDGSSATMTWYEASGTTDASYNPNGYSACASYSQDGKTGWRLPTIRELRLIYALRSELTSANLPSSDCYWSATERSSNSNYVWYVRFTGGLTNYDNKSYGYRVRCVRDL